MKYNLIFLQKGTVPFCMVKDIPSDSMAVGNPAKVIKSLKE